MNYDDAKLGTEIDPLVGPAVGRTLGPALGLKNGEGKVKLLGTTRASSDGGKL